MSLLINQGVQNTTTTNDFPIIVEKDVPLMVESLSLSQYKTNTLNVKFRIISGKHKNQFVFDSVEYDASSSFSYRYRQLRECAGVPYKQGEPTTIDIEALLKSKVVFADLKARQGKDKDGLPKEYQQIDYKKAPADTPSAPAPKEPVKQVAPAEPVVEEVSDDDLPFNSAPVTAGQGAVVQSADDIDDWD